MILGALAMIPPGLAYMSPREKAQHFYFFAPSCFNGSGNRVLFGGPRDPAGILEMGPDGGDSFGALHCTECVHGWGRPKDPSPWHLDLSSRRMETPGRPGLRGFHLVVSLSLS